MNRYYSKEIAFFNILSTVLNLSLNEYSTNFVIDLVELSEKINIEKSEIAENIYKLEKYEILKVKENQNDIITLDFLEYKTKLSEVFTSEEIDEMLMEFDYFIKKYNDLMITNDSKLTPYILKIKNILKEDPNSDLNNIIHEGIANIFVKEIIIILEKKIYNMCEVIDEEDLEIIEVILFCFYNFPKHENPFLVILFLSSVFSYIDEA